MWNSLTFAVNLMLIGRGHMTSYQTARWKLDCGGFTREWGKPEWINGEVKSQCRYDKDFSDFHRTSWSWAGLQSRLTLRQGVTTLYSFLGRPLDVSFSQEGPVNLDQGQFLERSWASHQCSQWAGNEDLNLKGRSGRHTAARIVLLDLRRCDVTPKDLGSG